MQHDARAAMAQRTPLGAPDSLTLYASLPLPLPEAALSVPRPPRLHRLAHAVRPDEAAGFRCPAKARVVARTTEPAGRRLAPDLLLLPAPPRAEQVALR